MNDVETAKLLGWFSLGLGTVEILAGGAIRRGLGLPLPRGVVQAFGAREIAAGALVLTNPDKAAPLWLRTGGDALDIVALAGAMLRPANRRRPAAGLALLAVLGVTVLDVMTAAALERRGSHALQIARSGRVA